MDIREALKTRKSIRDFKPDPVTQETLEEILNLACRAPSAMNTQPWEFFVLGGAVLAAVRQENLRLLSAGTMPQSEHQVVSWPQDSIYRVRQVDLAKELFRLMDIARDDKLKRAEWMSRGFNYFNAPAAIIILTDKSLGEASPGMDLGAVAQSICLAALSFGLGTCIEDQGVMYPEVLRRIAGVPESKRIMMSIALGRPNWDFPANRIETPRAPLADICSFRGFD